MKNLNNLLKILLENDIDFVLIGGFASSIYGSTLVTRDIDICALCLPENIKKLREILEDYHPIHRQTPQKLSFLEHPDNLKELQNLYLSTDLGVLDIISSVTGVGDFERVKSESIELPLFGRKCKVISLDDLIEAKKIMGREKDKIALKELEKIKEKQSS